MTKDRYILPKGAPFSKEQAVWIEGYLAGASQARALATVSGELGDTKDPITILFGSQTGNAQNIALDLAENLHGASVVDMMDISAEDFATLRRVIIITSTYGDGEQPDNGQVLWDDIQDASDLSSMQYAVLGLGDTAYDFFCKAAQDWHTLLEKAGAKPVLGLVKLDVDYEDHVGAWMAEVCSVFGVTDTPPSPQSQVSATQQQKPLYTKSNPFLATLLKRQLLSGKNSSKRVFHFEFSADDQHMQYEVGDTLGVIPTNSDILVEDILRGGNWTGMESVLDTTLKDALKHMLEIRLPNREFIEAVAHVSNDSSLNTTLDNKEKRADFLYGREILDFLQNYTVQFSAQHFVSLLKPLQHRLYSICSSPRVHKGQIHLTVARVEYDFHGRQCQGVASCFLADRLHVGDKVAVFLHANNNFSLPAQNTVPMIMVGPGTGIAPFRAFMEERLAIGATGENWLFFGDRTRHDDFLYEEELTQWQKDGNLRLSLAWSREKMQKKTYVQHRMLEHGSDVFDALERGGYFFVCGDANHMAKDVEAALMEIIAIHGAMTVEKAATYLNGLKKQKRYVRDVY